MTTDLNLPTAPIPLVVTRYICPYCNRGRSRRKTAEDHMAQCWKNPALKGCKTCVFFKRDEAVWAGGEPKESCAKGITLTDGLRKGCDKWQASPGTEEMIAVWTLLRLTGVGV